MSDELSRRAALLASASGAAVLLSGCAANAQQAKGPPAPSVPPAILNPGGLPGRHSVRPLPFDPAKLRNLSERLLVSHHENNYAGAVKNLNRVEEELGRVTKDTPGFVVGGLKQSELTFRNSATLHELYFANLGGDGKATAAVEKSIADTFGTFGRWEELFRFTAASLGGGSGWVVTAWDLHREAMFTFWSGNHSQGGAASVPLLVLDMYEHAYQMDYGAAAAKYVDAFFQNIRWDEVQKRLERAQKASLASRG